MLEQERMLNVLRQRLAHTFSTKKKAYIEKAIFLIESGKSDIKSLEDVGIKVRTERTKHILKTIS